MDTLGNRFYVNFLGYSYWFVSIRISQMKDHSISVDHNRYATSIVTKYLYTATVKVSTKEDVSTSDEQFENLTREFNIH